MNKKEVLKAIQTIATTKKLLLDSSKIKETTLIGEFFDSYSVMEIVMELEKVYGIYISRDEEDCIKTFGDLIEVITKK